VGKGKSEGSSKSRVGAIHELPLLWIFFLGRGYANEEIGNEEIRVPNIVCARCV
jgi:hypothetical protein